MRGCWGHFFDRNVQDGSKADFPLFSDASWKLYIFWATEYIFSKQILRRIFVLWSIVIDFSWKICETKFASRSGRRNKRKKSLGEISLSKEFREKEGYPFECFARAQSFSSSGSGGGEGSVTIEEEEKIAERGGSCAPCDELISSNVAGTSWMRENWCASRFRIIARRYTARVRASREITLSAKLRVSILFYASFIRQRVSRFVRLLAANRVARNRCPYEILVLTPLPGNVPLLKKEFVISKCLLISLLRLVRCSDACLFIFFESRHNSDEIKI